MSSWTRGRFAVALVVVLLSAGVSPGAPQGQCQKGQQLSKRMQARQLRGIIVQGNYRLTTSQFQILTTTYQAVQQTPQLSASDIQTLLLQQNPQLTASQLQVFTAILQTAQQQSTQVTTYQLQTLVQQTGGQGRGCAAGGPRRGR